MERAVTIYEWITVAIASVTGACAVVVLAFNPPIGDDDDYHGHGLFDR